MADNVVNVVFKADTTGLQKGLAGLQGAVQGLGSAFGQLIRGDLAGFSTSMYNLMGPVGIVTAGIVGLGTVAVSSAKNWMELAVTVGKFADATGTATEEASMLYEIANELKIPIGSLEMAAKKLAAEGIPMTIEGLAGLAEQYQLLQEPAERVAFLTANFGRSGQDLATILEMDTTALRNFHAEMTAGQFITEQEYQNALLLQGNLDALNDQWENAKLQIGGIAAIPLNEWLTGINNGFTQMGLVLSGDLNYFTALGNYLIGPFAKAVNFIKGLIDKLIASLRTALSLGGGVGTITPPRGAGAPGAGQQPAASSSPQLNSTLSNLDGTMQNLPFLIRDAINT